VNNMQLRFEARPFHYAQLQQRNKEVFVKIIKALKSAVSDIENNHDDSECEDRYEQNRRSRLFFVSGEPGSGKSTLQLSIAQAIKGGKSEYRKNVKEDQEKDPEKNLGPDLEELKSSVVWLETLDLEVIEHQDDNLLAAVLVRLFEALDRRGTCTSSKCEKAIKNLEELATDIGIAWGDNLGARASSLDPDTYAEEVMRAQRARLGVQKRLKKALNDLAKNECCGLNKNTLFVLPVDDIYLKPSASLQLLRLLRMISVPRLFYLLFGDMKTMEDLFQEKALADWSAVAGPEVFAAMTGRHKHALTRAGEMRSRFLRKLIPPAQRATIEAMDWYEALEFKPDPKHEPLKVLMAEICLNKKHGDNTSKCNENLFNFLVSPLYPAAGITEDNNGRKNNKSTKAMEAYTALQLLDGTPREMMDLFMLLQDMINSKDSWHDHPKDLLKRISEIVLMSLEEQSFLEGRDFQGVIDQLIPRRQYSDEIYFDFSGLSLSHDFREWTKLSDGFIYNDCENNIWKISPRFDSQPAVEGASGDVDLPIDKRQRAQRADESFDYFPPRPSAWIVLLHDLAVELKMNKGNLVKSYCEQLKDDKEAGGGDPSGQPLNLNGFLRYDSSGGPKGERKHCPMPPFEKFRDLDQFLWVWSELLKSRADEGKSDNDQHFLSESWLTAGHIILDKKFTEFVKAFDEKEPEKIISYYRKKANNWDPEKHELSEWGEWYKAVKDLFAKPAPDNQETI